MALLKEKIKADKKKRSAGREWLNATVFALIVSSLVHTFTVQAYSIPSGSMEGTLLINDYLLVNKMAYGPRLPITPIAFPLVQNTLPIIGGESYTGAVQLKYRRLPGFGSVERNDVVVFNGPAGDTALAGEAEKDYQQTLREYNGDREQLKANYKVVTRPIDMEENLVKRCVAIPGDLLEIKDAVLYVNGKPAIAFPHQKRWYRVETKGVGLSDDYIEDNNLELMQRTSQNSAVMNLANDQVAGLKGLSQVAAVNPIIYPKEYTENGFVFPQDTMNYKWSRDNFGPLTVPKAGITVQLTPQNIALYTRIIRNYEGNKLDVNNGKIVINGRPADSYTFKMDYYWMMGDNRDNSLDSRYWGFVPEDHIVGKAWLVGFSYNNDGILSGLRWKRFFHSVYALSR